MIRHNRIDQLSIMARRGATENEIFEKALSIGVTKPTAKSYIKALYARGEL